MGNTDFFVIVVEILRCSGPSWPMNHFLCWIAKSFALARSVPKGVEVGHMRGSKAREEKSPGRGPMQKPSGELAGAVSLRPWLAIPSLGRLRARTCCVSTEVEN